MEEKETEKITWLRCPGCGGKTRTQVRSHTVLEDFPLFCPKCKYTCVIYFKNGKIEEIKMPGVCSKGLKLYELYPNYKRQHQ